MKTIVTKDDIAFAAEIIKTGGLVAVPTETVYGLSAGAFLKRPSNEYTRLKTDLKQNLLTCWFAIWAMRSRCAPTYRRPHIPWPRRSGRGDDYDT